MLEQKEKQKAKMYLTYFVRHLQGSGYTKINMPGSLPLKSSLFGGKAEIIADTLWGIYLDYKPMTPPLTFSGNFHSSGLLGPGSLAGILWAQSSPMANWTKGITWLNQDQSGFLCLDPEWEFKHYFCLLAAGTTTFTNSISMSWASIVRVTNLTDFLRIEKCL